MTRVKARIEVAFRHFCHVIFVKELALVSLLTQSAQPMLADDCLVPPDMPERTGGRRGAVGPDIEITDGGTRLVHAREGERLGPQLVGERSLYVEDNVLHGCDQQLHPTLK